MKRGKVGDHRILPEFHDDKVSKTKSSHLSFGKLTIICLICIFIIITVYNFFSTQSYSQEKPLFDNAAIVESLKNVQPNQPTTKFEVLTQPKSNDILINYKPGSKYSEGGKPFARKKGSQSSLGKFDPPLSASISTKPLHTNYYLVIGINSIARYKEGTDKQIDYLAQSFHSLYNQLSAFFESDSGTAKAFISSGKRILIYVQDNTDDSNVSFDELYEKQQSFQYNHFDVLLFKNRQRFLDPFRDIPNHDYKAPENTLPGHKARQQNADIISTAMHALKHIQFDNYLFMEDDFLTCNEMPKELIRVMQELNNRDPNNCGLRISYGMNGIVLPRPYLQQFIDFMSYHIDMFPVDLMIRKYLFDNKPLLGLENKPLSYRSCRSSGREHYIYKLVLQEHIGQTSTFEERNKKEFRPTFPSCGYPMYMVWNLSEDERFSVRHCGGWSVTPCDFAYPTF